MRWPLILAVLGVVGACSSPGPTVCRAGAGPGGTGGGFGGGAGVPIGLAGKPMSVSFELSPPLGCNGTPPMASRVDVVVLDPANKPVSATSTPPAPDAVGQLGTTVTFTPMTPGPYHFNVRFEPNLGLVQKDAVVAIDKSTEPPVVVGIPVSPPVYCRQIDFDGDTLICLDSYQGDLWLRTIRAAQVVDQVQADAFAFSEGKVWTHSNVDQNLYVFALGADGRLTPEGSLNGNFSVQPQILAHGDRALVLDVINFVEVTHHSDGTFTVSQAVPLSNPGGAQWVPDVGVAVSNQGGSEVCSFAPDAGSCLENLTVIGYDDDGVWWIDSPAPAGTMAVHVAGWRAGEATLATGGLGLLPVDPPNSAYGQWVPQVSPVLLGGVSATSINPTELYVPRFDGKDVTLVRYPFIAETISADSKRIWFSGTDTITWYPR